MKKSLKTAVGIVVVITIFVYLIRIILVNWNQVKGFEWHLNYLHLVLSFFFFAFGQLFSVWLWMHLLDSFGYRLSFRRLFIIWWISAMGRYLPGKVWQLVGLAVMGEKEGVPAEVTTSASVLTQVLAILSGFLISIPVILSQQRDSIYLLSAVIIGLGILVYPPIFRKWINFIGRRIRGIEINVHLDFWNLLKFLALYLVLWISYGLGFGFFVKGISRSAFYFNFISIYAFSYIVGLLTIFVPGGFGVREGLMAAFLKRQFGTAVASTISIAARLWVTLVEVFFFTIALAMTARRKNGA